MSDNQFSLNIIIPLLRQFEENNHFQHLLNQSERYLQYGPNSSELLSYKYRALVGLKQELNDIGFLRKYCWYNGLDEHGYYSLHQAYLKEGDKHNALISLAYALSLKSDFVTAKSALDSILESLGFSQLNIFMLTSDRIGHLTTEPDSWLRKQKVEKKANNCLNLFISDNNHANEYLYSLLQRHINIVENPYWAKIYWSRPHLLSSDYYGTMPLDLKSCRRVPNSVNEEKVHKQLQHLQQSTEPVLELNPEELSRGWNLLLEKEIEKNSKIVCFHVRDNAYLLKGDNPINDVYHDVRDMDIATYEKAVKYLLSINYVVIRIGCDSNQELSLKHKNYYDFCIYRDKKNGDFLDVFLLSVCQFFIGNTSGVFGIANCFDTPVLGLNMIPYGILHAANSRYIPKYYIDEKGAPVNFSKMWDGMTLNIEGQIKSGLSSFYPPKVLVDNGFTFQDNSDDEILDSVVEFSSQIENRVLKAEFTPLQQAYLDAIPDTLLMKHCSSVLTDSFLRKNLNSFNLRDI